MTMSKSFGRPYPPSQRVVEYERNIQTGGFGGPRNVLTFKCTFPTFRYLLERSIGNIRLDLNVLLVLSGVSLDDYFINSILHQFTIKGLGSLGKNEVDLPVDPIEVADFASGIFLAGGLVNLIARFSNKNLRHLISSRKEKVKFQDRDIGKISDNFLSEKVSLSKKCKVVNIIKHNARKSAVVETKIDLNFPRNMVIKMLEESEGKMSEDDKNQYLSQRLVIRTNYQESLIRNTRRHPGGLFVVLGSQEEIKIIKTEAVNYRSQ